MIVIPILLAVAGLFFTSAEACIIFCAIGTVSLSLYCAPAVFNVFTTHTPLTSGKWFFMDGLSAFHLTVMLLVFSLSAIYAISYFKEEIKRSAFGLRTARRYTCLWFGAISAMLLVLLSNNIVIMWVGIEATTILTAFLICIHITPTSLEAMWKYLLMCSVGVAMAFIGTLLVAASTAGASDAGANALFWTDLAHIAATLNPTLIKAGFIFAVVGYGTKAGLAPMHNWLPDAHSQAPSPVSAIFSGFLLNCALFCILRFLPIVEASTGNTGWGNDILILLGILSVVVSAVFIPAQHDVKRLLAYCSVEHIGIIAIGVGMGGLGCFAALLHTFNHSIAKTLSFFCAGRLVQFYKNQDMRHMTNVTSASPVWGSGLIISMLTLIGLAPFSIFISEFLVLKSVFDRGSYFILAILLACIALIFMSMLKNVIMMAWQPATDLPARRTATALEKTIVVAMSAAVLLPGIWIYPHLESALKYAASFIGGGL